MTDSFDKSSSRESRRSVRQNSADEWDSVFADEDPTRVLSPDSAGDNTEVLERTEYLSHSGDADRTEVFDRTEVLKNDSLKSSGTSDRTESFDQPYVEAVRPPRGSYSPTESSAPGSGSAPTSPSPSSFTAEQQGRNSRIHLFPALLGWLALYSMLTFSAYLHRLINQIFGLENFDGFPTAFAQLIGLTASDTGASASGTWLIISSVLTILSAGFGGYAAARMARFAPAKQAMGVWLWHIAMVVFATILAFFARSSLGTGVPGLSLQGQIAGSWQNVLGVLLFIIVILLGALLGSVFGPRYHKRINRPAETLSDF